MPNLAPESLAVPPANHSRLNARLGIITGTTAARDERGRLFINHSIGRLIEALAERAASMRLCLPILPERQHNMNHPIDLAEDQVVALPPLRSTLAAQRYCLSTWRILRQFEKSVDVIFARAPFQIPDALASVRCPTLMHVVSSPYEVVRASTDRRGPMRHLAMFYAHHTEMVMKKVARRPTVRLATNGRQMWDKLSPRAGRVVVSSCLREAEMRPRPSPQLNDPPKLLFVGYLRPEKGIHVLIEAFDRLRQHRRLKLTLVGGSDRAADVGRSPLDQFARSAFPADITHAGMLNFGEDLFEFYRNHDVYVLPSLSEGTPRTLVEARSFGCPVVASRVGGIPSSVEDGVDGLLVEPQDAGALAAAIERLLDDSSLRRRLIERGIERSRQMSLERFADQLTEELNLLWRETRGIP